MKSPWIITPSELKSELGRVKLVDVREREEHEESRIEGCTLIPLGELDERAGELSKDDDIVLYCAHGIRSLQAVMSLRVLGFKKLRSLEGGIVAWQEQQS